MERFLPGVIVAGIAGLVGLTSQSATHQENQEPPKSGIIQKEHIDSDTVQTASHRGGFTPAQDIVCEPANN
jgi:hypothetical protein